ncbi:hypothetical protein D3OALGA1CA_4165 [Olavius algarvensis associated proteobacterium Delta 3]|nr:hypothetical protein D3OALGB2SA_1378 [Olavius algarvensis associated proteobacterium Delta 3]CAB5146437.1 hypothetical protein D3OALGA1CA_4165 [Olavius algarvensis associated proteobacterium Delta 3]
MTFQLPATVPALVSAMEMVLFFMAGFAFFRGRGYTFPEAVSVGLITVLMILSLVFQVALLLGAAWLAPIFEVLITLIALRVVWRGRHTIAELPVQMRHLIGDHSIAGLGLCVAAIYLLTQAIVIGPGITHWADMADLLLFQHQGGFFTTPGIGPEWLPERPGTPQNALILPHMLLRFGTDAGVGLFGFTAWLSVGFATYSLARRYAWPPTAFTVTLVVMSFPRLVLLATTPAPEMVAAASALVCLLALYRLGEEPNISDMCLLTVGILFCISGRVLSLTFPIVLMTLTTVLLFRRHGAGVWWQLISDHRGAALATLFPAAIFSQIWLFGHHLIHHGRWTDAPLSENFAPNTDALFGAGANLLRYGLEMVHLTLPVEHVSNWMFGFSPIRFLEGIHTVIVTSLFGAGGTAAEFRILWFPDEALAWFGPYGALLTVPALVYALIRGPRRLKAIAIALTVYVYILCLVPAWMPGNAWLFTSFFVCSGFCIAFFLPPWRLTSTAKLTLQVVSILLLVYAATANTMKPLISLEGLLVKSPDSEAFADLPRSAWAKQSIWRNIPTSDRQMAMAAHVVGDDRLSIIDRSIQSGNRVGLVGDVSDWLVPLLISRPDVHFFRAPAGVQSSDMMALAGHVDYLVYVNRPPPTGIPGQIIWEAPPDAKYPGAIIRLEVGRDSTGT